MYGYGGFRPYVSVAERLKKAAKVAKKMNKKGQKVSPIQIDGKIIAKSFWGKSWCDHLESFSDYENRLPRGRAYVRNGSVIHLSVEEGVINALVQGSSLYKIKIEIREVDSKKWKQISDNCSGQIDSVIELLQGKLSSAVMKTITHKDSGLFPAPKEISLNCSCPDSAYMCKHLAAVLYGVGARLDNEPELLFKLRHVDHLDLITKATLKTPTTGQGKHQKIADQSLSNLFGIDIESTKKEPAQLKPVKLNTVKLKSVDKLTLKSKKKTGKKKLGKLKSKK